MLTSDFDYELPENLIAQYPTKRRSASRMMVLDKSKKEIDNKHFFDIVDYLGKDDVLILNNTKVIPARLLGKKTTGANIEVFLLKNLGDRKWEALVKPSKTYVIDFFKKVLAKAKSTNYFERRICTTR